MSDTTPLAWRADAIEAALEVAGELATLQASETVASHVCTTRHIGAIIDLARIATRCLAVELEEPSMASLADEAMGIRPEEARP